MFQAGDLIRRRGGRYTWRVILVTPEGYLHARCDDKPGVTRVILRPDTYETQCSPGCKVKAEP